MHTRRQFLRRSAPFAAAVVVPQLFVGGVAAARTRPLRGGRFADGVISGDPTTTSINLWTRVDGVDGTGTVTVEVATDKAFKHVVTTRAVTTSEARNHTVKAAVTGLKPHEQYYYRFATATEDSPVGRFRTALPADSNQPVRLAFFSCADYTHGYYNAYEKMAAEDVDFVVCLGDYIYDESYHSTADGTGVRNDPIGKAPPAADKRDVIRRAVSLEDYRAKYALYRSDASLRKMHAAHPMVVLWDDHEVQDNYAGGAGALGGLPAAQQYSRSRRAAAYQAFFESMPVSPKAGTSRIYRSLRFGKNVELFVMDQRQYRADQPCDDVSQVACADYNQPRAFLGSTQMTWLKNGLSASQANWKLLANEVMMMPVDLPGNVIFNFDGWQGYPTEREELLQHIRTKAIKDVVFLTGDIHTFIVGDVRTNMGLGESVAVEFVGGSITSAGLGEQDLNVGGATIKGNDKAPDTPGAIVKALAGLNPWIDTADVDHHGYAVVEASPTGLRCDLVRMQTIKRRSTATLPGAAYSYEVTRGRPTVVGQHPFAG